MRIQVKDFMSTPVATAIGESNVQEIRTLMKSKKVQSIPIVQYARQLPNAQVTIRGIITASDLSQEKEVYTTAADLMSTKVHVIHKDSSARAAAKMMVKHKVHHLVVMDDGKIIGMISSLDFVKLVSEYSLDLV